MKVRDYAVVRGGDKGDSCHFAIAASDRDACALLWERLTPELVSSWVSGEPSKTVDRYQLPNIDGIVLVVHDLLEGGAGGGWALHKQFVLAEHLMELEV